MLRSTVSALGPGFSARTNVACFSSGRRGDMPRRQRHLSAFRRKSHPTTRLRRFRRLAGETALTERTESASGISATLHRNADVPNPGAQRLGPPNQYKKPHPAEPVLEPHGIHQHQSVARTRSMAEQRSHNARLCSDRPRRVARCGRYFAPKNAAGPIPEIWRVETAWRPDFV
jgi:hypothetical protein